jgi:hypothetical protein
MILQIAIIIGVLFFLGMIILLLRKGSLSLRNALLWLLTAVAMLIFGIFPNLLGHLSEFLGFEMPVNALFTALLGFVIIILLQQTATISRQSESIKTLIQTNSLLEKRIRDLEARHNVVLNFKNKEDKDL